jgi:diguanylate cyclase (GGDEF)-like protein
VGTVLVVAPLLSVAEGPRVAVVVNAAYPLADLLLFGLCVAVCAWHGWRPGRGWILLALGFGLFAAANSVYLMRLAAGTYSPGSVLDSSWVVGLVVMSLAAWQPAPTTGEVELRSRASLILPLAFSTAALAVLLAGSQMHLPLAATAFAGGAMLLSMVRTALTFSEIGRLSEVRQLAATDELTGLPNRREFNRQLQRELALASDSGEPVALLLIDLDRFKELNDALGHRAGDMVLGQVGPRLRSVLRSEDILARVGGDEFAVLLPGAVGVEDIGNRLAAALDHRFTVDGIDMRIAVSVGIAVYPTHGADADTLLQHADVAMYQAKSTHAGFAFYAPERDRNTRERLELIGELRDAIGTDQLVLHYQPKLELKTGRITEVEALVRWEHPVHGLLPPARFVTLAEQTGVMHALTWHVLDRALAQCAAWARVGIDLQVAVNVSAATLIDPIWAAEVGERLQHHGLPAKNLRIEITEDAIMSDAERSLLVLRSLAAAGVGVSIDDFGTGYSSLGLLKHMPVDELKIDRSFIANVAEDDDDAAIVKTSIDLGRNLGLRVVAEGVEDADTLELLAAWGASSAQGYFISRPVSAVELEAWLTARSPHALVS